MALANYTDLQARVASWLHRSDLTSDLPDFIALAESRLNRRLRLRAMESDQALTLTSGTSSIALPDGFVDPVALWIEKTEERHAVRFVSPGNFQTYTAQGEPEAWTIDGANIEFDRPADGTYSITFRMLGAFALSEANPTNWLLTNHPDAYLYAVNVEVALYLRDSEDVATYSALLDRALDEIQNKENRSKKRATLSVETQMLPRRWEHSSEYVY